MVKKWVLPLSVSLPLSVLTIVLAEKEGIFDEKEQGLVGAYIISN